MATQTQRTEPWSGHAAFGRNFIGGRWVPGEGPHTRLIRNPADTTECVAEVREASAAQIEEGCEAAARAFTVWRAVPATERVRVLFRYRQLLEDRFDDLATLVVKENGKLLSEARGSVRRGIDVVEFACGIPSLLMGKTLPEISRDVDSYVVREPVGVAVGIPPFNFPAMIPLWMMPLAVACGNSFVLKPSEKSPLTGAMLASFLAESGLPPGVVTVIHGGRETAESLIANRHVRAVSFVGSSAVAESVYRTASAAGKRVQALGGAKNHLVVMPDADLARSMPALIGSTYGCAGQRCLAGSVIVAVGDRARQDEVVNRFVDSARSLKLGDGMDPAAELCPVQSHEHHDRVIGWIERGVAEGARLALDGRHTAVPSLPRGAFLGASVFDDVAPEMAIAREEIFGPVVVMLRARDLDEAIALANRSAYGNSASIFTQSGAAVKTFRSRIQCGMIGVNLGVPAPMAFFSFGGWKQSLFGDLHAHGPDAIEFYTRKKVVTERWFGAEAPKEGWV
ncbi:MAG: CoA-acylating methylmalonate-semialdehyde dehydrogenase [Acidobacteria bacterium]|nr:CoA-acylating methylmalonate-semialdehyde dehydrogenase [Acidobacteriota bacterium]